MTRDTNIAKHLAFAAGYLDQARIDRAAGRDDMAEFCMTKRRKHQAKLALIRAVRSVAPNCTCCDCPACDARIDRWNDGAVDGARGRAMRSTDPDYALGYLDGRDAAKVRPVMPVRAEGYYHTNPNGE